MSTDALEKPLPATDEAQAAFDAAFAEFEQAKAPPGGGDDPTPPGERKPEPESGADNTPSGQAAPFGGNGESVDADRAAQEAARAEHKRKLDLEEQRLRSDAGRVLKLQSENQQLQQELAALRAAAKAPPVDQPSKVTPPASSEKLKALKEEYPEIAEPILEELESLRAQTARYADRFAKMDEAEQQQTIIANESALAAQHPDWLDRAKDPRFGAWLNDQPTPVREMFKRNAANIINPEEAAYLIGRFKQDVPAGTQQQAQQDSTEERRRRQLEGAAAPSTKGKPGAAGGAPNDYGNAWDYFAEKRNLAR
jgi:hypothetical protein